MRKLLLVCGALLVFAGIFSTSLWRHLRIERQATAELQMQLAQARTAAGVRASPTQSIAAPHPAAMPGCPAVAAALAPGAAKLMDTLLGMALDVGAAASSIGEKDLVLGKDPEYRKAQLTMTRMRLPRTNPGLAETLGLSDAEANHLFDVLAETQLNGAAANLDPTTALAEALRRASGADDPVRTTLGEARFAQFQDYQRNIRPALTSVASLGSTLTSAGQPMSDSQSRALTAALLAEQQRQRREVAVPRSIPDPGATRGRGDGDALEENNSRQDEASRRILAAAASSLGPAQLQVLRQQFEQEAATRRTAIDAVRRALSTRPQFLDPQGMK